MKIKNGKVYASIISKNSSLDNRTDLYIYKGINGQIFVPFGDFTEVYKTEQEYLDNNKPI